MKDFITEYKTLARNKNISIQDVIARCLYKAIKAKNPNKKEVFLGLLRRAFTPGAIRPHRPIPYWTLWLSLNGFKYTASKGRRVLNGEWVATSGKVLGQEVTEFLDGDDLELWYEILTIENMNDVMSSLRKVV